MDRYPSNANDLLTVHHNDWVGGRIAARFLQRKGCKRVIIVKQTSEHEPDQHLSPLKDRERGCREELKRLGIESRRLRPEGDGAAGAKLALEKFENGEDQILPTDGIFATSDRAALGCRSYLTTRKNGALRIPVIGFEGQAFGEYLTPQLPSVFADPEALGKLAARVLLSVISGEASPAPDQHPHYLVQPVLLEPNEEIGIREQVYTSLDDPLQGYR